jgi:hypothetical protein
MAKNDRDLFNRLRNVGLRKQVARTLSGIGEDAGKKAIRAARSAVSELRSLADDIEGRLPSLPGTGGSSATRRSSGRSATSARSASSSAGSRRSSGRAAGSRAAGSRASGSRSTSRSRSTGASRGGRAASSGTRSSSSAGKSSGRRAPRGANKAKILAALQSGPKTAADIAKETGIGVGTVGSTLTKMAGSGEVQKAARGYALPR